MRQKLNAYLAQGIDSDLDEFPRAAIERLNQEMKPVKGSAAMGANRP